MEIIIVSARMYNRKRPRNICEKGVLQIDLKVKWETVNP